MSVVFRFTVMLMMALLLAACGGGGGSGGGGNTGAEQTTAKSVSLRGAELPVQRSALQTLDISGFSLSEEVYTADVDGASVSLVKVTDKELAFLLPAQLEAGAHRIRVTLGGKDWSIPFEIASFTLRERSLVVADLDILFQQFRTAMDDAIAAMQEANAPQADIDDMLANRTLLDTESTEFLALTDSELNYLLELLELLADDTAEGKSTYVYRDAVTSPDLAMSRATATDCEYARPLRRSVAKLALGISSAALLGSTGIGSIVGAGILGYSLATELPKALNYLELAFDNCWVAHATEILESFPATAMSATAKSVSVPVIVSGKELDFESAVSLNYQLRVQKSGPEGIAAYLVKISDIAAFFATLLSVEEKGLLDNVTAEDYAEFADPAGLSLEGISDAGVQGELLALDEDSFSLTFTAESLASDGLDFTFLINDSLNLVKTQLQATLTVTEHCPFVVSDGHDIVPMADKCIIIQHHVDGHGPAYMEYRYGVVVLTEIFDSGGVNLKSLKGLDAFSQVGNYSVETPPYWHEESIPFSDGEGYYYSVPSYLETNVDGHRDETDYSAPYLDEYGSWSSSPLQQRTYYPNGDYAQYDYTVVDGWGSVFKYDLWDSSSGSREIFYTAPLEASVGWTSVPDYQLNYSDGLGSEITARTEYTTISTGGGWSYYTSRLDDYVNDCYVTYAQSGNTLTDTCTPPVE